VGLSSDEHLKHRVSQLINPLPKDSHVISLNTELIGFMRYRIILSNELMYPKSSIDGKRYLTLEIFRLFVCNTRVCVNTSLREHACATR
jgi:hypothetical protein